MQSMQRGARYVLCVQIVCVHLHFRGRACRISHVEDKEACPRAELRRLPLTGASASPDRALCIKAAAASTCARAAPNRPASRGRWPKL